MVKVDIIRKIQLQEGLQFSEAEIIVNSVLTLIKDTLVDGEDSSISGFGKFELSDKKSRPGRNPKSLESYEISARRTVSFLPGKTWRNELNGN